MAQLVLTSDTLAGTPATGTLEYNGQFYGTDSAAARAQMQRITQGTAVASTSGTSIDFTSIPAWVKKITVMFQGVSSSGTSVPIIQLGVSGGPVVTGYTGSASIIAGTVATANNTVGIGLAPSWGAAITVSGVVVISLLNTSTNLWSASVNLGDSVAANMFVGGSSIALSGALTSVRLKAQNGTDTFDAGSVNILYEG